MKVKCPYCKRPLKIPYEKIKQRVLDENPSSYGPWIAAIVAGIGIAGALGLVGGTILTRSNEKKAQIQITQLQRELAKLTRDQQTATAESKEERDQQTATAELKKEVEKQVNDHQAAINEKQQVEPQQITRRSISSRLGQRDLSNIKTLQPDDPRFPIARNPRRRSQPLPVPNSDLGSPKRNESSLHIARNPRSGFQPAPVPESKSDNLQSETSTQSVLQNSELITFLPGERASEISIISEINQIGISQFKANKAPQGFYFHIVQSNINTLPWPKEKILYFPDETTSLSSLIEHKDGVRIKNTDIVLETVDGRLIHPSFVSYGVPVSLGSKKVGFASGPFENIALFLGQANVNGTKTNVMWLYVTRPGPEKNMTETERIGLKDTDPKEVELFFAFLVPHNAEIKTVSLNKSRRTATKESPVRSRPQTPPAELNRSIETPLGTCDVSDVAIAYPKKGETITVNQYELRQNHVLVIVPVTTKKKRTLTCVSDWSLVSIDGRKCPLVGVKDPDGKIITGIGSMSAAGSPRSPQTTEFLFDVPIGAGPLDLYIGTKCIEQVFSEEISPSQSTPRPRGQ